MIVIQSVPYSKTSAALYERRNNLNLITIILENYKMQILLIAVCNLSLVPLYVCSWILWLTNTVIHLLLVCWLPQKYLRLELNKAYWCSKWPSHHFPISTKQLAACLTKCWTDFDSSTGISETEEGNSYTNMPYWWFSVYSFTVAEWVEKKTGRHILICLRIIHQSRVVMLLNVYTARNQSLRWGVPHYKFIPGFSPVFPIWGWGVWLSLSINLIWKIKPWEQPHFCYNNVHGLQISMNLNHLI